MLKARALSGNAIASLGLEEKHKLWQILDEQSAKAEDNLLKEDPNAEAEIEEARTAYQVGDYLTSDAIAPYPLLQN